MLANSYKWFAAGSLLVAIATAIGTPLLAQNANFGKLTLSVGFSPATGMTRGNTGGSYSLSTISNRDRGGNFCIGFSDPTPDHILELQTNFSRLKLQVNSPGNQTSLLIQGPDGVIYCADNIDGSEDTVVEESSWKSGTYRLWVGSVESGVRLNYTLSVRE